MRTACAARLRLTLTSAPADSDAGLEALGLIAFKGKVMTADALDQKSLRSL